MGLVMNSCTFMQLESRSGAHRSLRAPHQAAPGSPTTPKRGGIPPSQQRQRPPLAAPSLRCPKRLHTQVLKLLCCCPDSICDKIHSSNTLEILMVDAISCSSSPSQCLQCQAVVFSVAAMRCCQLQSVRSSACLSCSCCFAE